VDDDVEDSAETARSLFEWLIAPITVEDFYENYWEKKPLLVQRTEAEYYDGWFSKVNYSGILHSSHFHAMMQADMDKMMREEEMCYGTVILPPSPPPTPTALGSTLPCLTMCIGDGRIWM
jgi:hypothetical protein